MKFKDVEVGTIFDTFGEICIKIREIKEYNGIAIVKWNSVCIYGNPGKLYSFIDELEVNTKIRLEPNIMLSIENIK